MGCSTLADFKNGKPHTPSGWHDDAMHRDAGHDAMQHELWKWLKLTPQWKYLPANVDPETVRKSVEFEMPFHSNADRYYPSAVIAFADVGEVWECNGCTRWLTLYEVKPKIGSVGAVVRQCEALRNTLGNYTKNFRVIAVVPHDDPKLAMLSDVMGEDHVLAWRPENMTEFRARLDNAEAKPLDHLLATQTSDDCKALLAKLRARQAAK
jgi:hypothetical protein